MKRKLLSISATAAASFFTGFIASDAWAISAPTDTSALLYPVYDLVVIKLGSGPGMFTVGFIGICVAGYFLWHTQLGKFVSTLIGTTMLILAGAIVPTLGLTF
jgi:hypothetical protein